MGIETYKESRLHRQLKELYSGGSEYTEIKCGNWICDIINNKGEITEIQTRNLSALEKKVGDLTKNHPVRIVHPIIGKKIIEKTDKTGTKIISRRISPKKETPEKIFTELTRLWPYISNPNFTILLVCCEIVELRRETEEKKTRGNNYTVENKTLIKINKEITLAGKEDYLAAGKIPSGKDFTVSDLKKAGNKYGGYTLWVLKRATLIKETGKQGRKKTYRLV